MRKKIGECLVQAGLITETDLQTALVEHKRSGERLGGVLVRLNLATERQIAKALAYQLGFAYVNPAENPPDPSAVVLIPKDVALKRTCIAIAVEKNLLTVAMSDPLLFTLVQDLDGAREGESWQIARDVALEAKADLEMASLQVLEAKVGDPSPLKAIEAELDQGHYEYDGIIISTLPPGISRWLQMDLPSRAQRRFNLRARLSAL